jgi:hypothetical protein
MFLILSFFFYKTGKQDGRTGSAGGVGDYGEALVGERWQGKG